METKEAHLANLMRMAKADGVLHPMESIFIQAIAVRMGISQTSFARIAAMPEMASSRITSNEEERLKQFCELIILSQVDVQKSEEEKKLLYEIGAQMHIPSQKVDNLEAFLEQNRLPEDISGLMEKL